MVPGGGKVDTDKRRSWIDSKGMWLRMCPQLALRVRNPPARASPARRAQQSSSPATAAPSSPPPPQPAAAAGQKRDGTGEGASKTAGDPNWTVSWTRQAPKCVPASILERGLQTSVPLAPQSNFCVFATPASSMPTTQKHRRSGSHDESQIRMACRHTVQVRAPGPAAGLQLLHGLPSAAIGGCGRVGVGV